MIPEPQGAATRAVAHEILRYLVDHPAAKDTLEGIAEWWITRGPPAPILLDVERAVSLLVAKGLLRETRREGLTPYYALAPGAGGAVSEFANDP